MDSFIPILFSSSISRRSDMWLPMPILLFICASACCQDKMQEIEKKCKVQELNFVLAAKANLDFICNLR